MLLADLDSDRVGLALTPVTQCFAGIEWPPPDWRAFEPWDGSLQDYEGGWESDRGGGTAQITANDLADTLEIEIDGTTYSLRPIGRDVFERGARASDGLVSFWPDPAEPGRRFELRLERGTSRIRVKPGGRRTWVVRCDPFGSRCSGRASRWSAPRRWRASA